jgi:hypothetical protein
MIIMTHVYVRAVGVIMHGDEELVTHTIPHRSEETRMKVVTLWQSCFKKKQNLSFP